MGLRGQVLHIENRAAAAQHEVLEVHVLSQNGIEKAGQFFLGISPHAGRGKAPHALSDGNGSTPRPPEGSLPARTGSAKGGRPAAGNRNRATCREEYPWTAAG